MCFVKSLSPPKMSWTSEAKRFADDCPRRGKNVSSPKTMGEISVLRPAPPTSFGNRVSSQPRRREEVAPSLSLFALRGAKSASPLRADFALRFSNGRILNFDPLFDKIIFELRICFPLHGGFLRHCG